MESVVKTSTAPTIEGLKAEIENENGSEEKRKRASMACLNCSRKVRELYD